MGFKIGDKVIYPNHGLGVVEKVEEKTILGTTCGFFHLRILSNETTVLVPVANVDNVGLRRAITVIKSRAAEHALTIHELELGAGGIRVGEALEGFDGVLSGLPSYRGLTPMMSDLPDAAG